MAMFGLFGRGRSPEDEFAHRAIRRLRERGWREPIQYDRSAFALLTDAQGGAFYFGKVFRDWQTYSKREQSGALDRALNVVFEAAREDPSFEEIAGNLLPVVRNLAHLQLLALDSPDGASAEIWQPHRTLADPLGIVLAIDLPTSIALVETSRLDAWVAASMRLSSGRWSI